MVEFYYAKDTVSNKVTDSKEYLSFTCLSQDSTTLDDIQSTLGDTDITKALFKTENGDILEELYVAYNTPSFEVSKTWERVTRFDDIEEYLMHVLPHGSGINSDWNITIVDGLDTIECSNIYEHMSSNGFYDGDMPFIVTLQKLPTRLPANNFSVLSVEAEITELLTVDDDGEEYNDLEGTLEYLSELFGSYI